ncbi:MAG TPA: hypothetical protein VKU19_23190 [Bryobacteraceae bacterium]|nr:hypothetical protein [Bryobacteraceae bacterium]
MSKRSGLRLWIAGALALGAASAQQAQNPSPMVEHTRAHLRLHDESPQGRRVSLDLGTLFIPAGIKARTGVPVLFFFHGGPWLPEVAAARNRIAVIHIQAGTGSGTYSRLFEDPKRFVSLVEDAESKGGVHFGNIMLGGWSAGCGAVRQILKTPASYDRVSGVLLIDGMHTDYAEGKPGPLESQLDASNLEVWLKLGRDSIAGRKRVVVTHSEIFPGTYASTTETADYLVAQLGLKLRAVLKWGPMGTQQLSEAVSGKFRLLGFAGNSAPDHVDQLHSLPVFLKWLH